MLRPAARAPRPWGVGPGAVRPGRSILSVKPHRFVTLDLETVPDERLVSAVDGEPSRPYAEQVGRLLAERRARSGGRTDPDAQHPQPTTSREVFR